MTDLSRYDYELPEDLIAQHPAPHRVDARLMVIDRASQTIRHHYVRDLPRFLRRGDSLVLNNTRVVPARLVGVRNRTGGRWEGLFLEVEGQGLWRILSKTRGHLQPGETVTLLSRARDQDIELRFGVKTDDGHWIVRPASDEDPWSVLERVGRIPLPPYIRKGEMLDIDRATYQTVYATEPGAVAAPTAGLHFTEQLLADLGTLGVDVLYVTLHVGIGTFRPMSVERIEEHRMHAEWGELSPAACERLRRCRASGGRIVAVGTTCVRVLETAAGSGVIQPFRGHTDLFIRPAYEFKAVDCLMTNFHLPKSTLLVLVRAFGGDALLRRAYEEAIAEQYRFYSYGDAMLIL